jgi:hypothetical protein
MPHGMNPPAAEAKPADEEVKNCAYQKAHDRECTGNE